MINSGIYIYIYIFPETEHRNFIYTTALSSSCIIFVINNINISLKICNKTQNILRFTLYNGTTKTMIIGYA